MDFFAHGFWSFLLFHRYRWRWYALFFGLLPDLASWFIFFWYNLFAHAVQWSSQANPDLSGIPQWTWTLYSISHSLIVWLAVIIMVAMFLRRWPVFMFTGVIAILMDIPTHSADFLPTPFLWPLSDFHFPGISWGSWWFMILNYSILAIAYTYFFVYAPCIEGRAKLGKRWQAFCSLFRRKSNSNKKTEKN